MMSDSTVAYEAFHQYLRNRDAKRFATKVRQWFSEYKFRKCTGCGLWVEGTGTSKSCFNCRPKQGPRPPSPIKPRTPEYKAAQVESAKKHRRDYPEKVAARMAVNNAIRSGKIKRQSCEVCASVKSEAHHDDYGKPFDVRWLCKSHHHEYHRQFRRR